MFEVMNEIVGQVKRAFTDDYPTYSKVISIMCLAQEEMFTS